MSSAIVGQRAAAGIAFIAASMKAFRRAKRSTAARLHVFAPRRLSQQKIESADWGDGLVDELAGTLTRHYPGTRGYTRRDLFRMRQFFEGVSGSKESVTAGDTFALDPSPHHLAPDFEPETWAS